MLNRTYDYMTIEPEKEAKKVANLNWISKEWFLYKTKDMNRRYAFRSNDNIVYFLLSSNERLEDQTHTVFAIKIPKESSKRLLPLSQLDESVIQELVFFHRSVGKIEKIMRKQRSREFSLEVLEEMGRMAARFKNIDTEIVEMVVPHRFLNDVISYIAYSVSDQRYFKMVELVNKFLFEDGDPAVFEKEIKLAYDREKAKTELIDVSNRPFMLRLGPMDCYMRATGTCSLNLSEDHYMKIAEIEKENSKRALDEDSVHYCVRFRDYILQKGIENINPSDLYEHSACGHSSFGGGQHRACIAKRSGHLLHATIHPQGNNLCQICSTRRAGDPEDGREFLDTELLA